MEAASLPTVYLSCGFSDVTACSMVFAASSGGEDDDALSIIDLKWFSIFFVSGKYGDFGSKDFFAETLEFMMLVLIKPGSIMTTLIPNGASSYEIDSLKPSNANFVLWYADKTGTPTRPPTELTF